MKFVHYLEKISHVTTYAYISLGIFFFFFLGVLIYVFRSDKDKLDAINRLPLD